MAAPGDFIADRGHTVAISPILRPEYRPRFLKAEGLGHLMADLGANRPCDRTLSRFSKPPLTTINVRGYARASACGFGFVQVAVTATILNGDVSGVPQFATRREPRERLAARKGSRNSSPFLHRYKEMRRTAKIANPVTMPRKPTSS
jgi:hypothetical protein